MEKNSIKRVVYSPKSALTEPKELVSSMSRDIKMSRELAWRLFIRDTSAKYRKTYFGYLWAIIPPIITSFVFVLANNAKVISTGDIDLPYPAFVLLSTTLWMVFVNSINGPLDAIRRSKNMLTKINFPKEAILIAKIYEIGFDFFIKLFLILSIFIWYGITIQWTLIPAFFALCILVMFGFVLGMMIIPIGALYDDIQKAMTSIISLWMFFTPVIYGIPKQGILSVMMRYNPVTPLLVTTRELATTGSVSYPMEFLMISIITFVGLFISWILYRISIPILVERMSA